MSEIARIAMGIAGMVLVGLVLADVFHSVILPRATRRRLRLGPMLGATTLRLVLLWARHRPRHRHGVLGALGPLLVVIELLIWVALLIFGYGLMLHATQGLKPASDLPDALYAAASAFVTTGLSGQEAATGMARAVVACAGFSGLTIVTLVVTFLLSIQSGLLRREALVLRLRARIGTVPSGVLILETLWNLGPRRHEALGAFFVDWEAWAADVLLTHRAFPVMVYFRSTDDDCGWMAALGAVLDAAALVIVIEHEDAGQHAETCHRMGARLIAELARQFGLKAPLQPGIDEPAFQTALARLEHAGHVLPADPTLLWPRFQELRSQHAPPLHAMTARFGEPAAIFLPTEPPQSPA